MQEERKNKLLLATYVISMLPSAFVDLKAKLYYVGFFSEKAKTLSWFLYYYTISINFLILAYCLHYPKGIDKRVTRFILLISMLDLTHLLYNGKQGYGVAKIGIATFLFFGYEFYKKKYGEH